MEAIYRHDGRMRDFVAAADQVAGDIIRIDSDTEVGVVAADVSSGETGTVHTEGIFSCLKDGAAYSLGDRVEWDGSTVVATAGTFDLGVVRKAAAAGDATVDVEINAEIMGGQFQIIP